MSDQLIRKIIITFLLLLVMVGAVYVGITLYFTTKYFEEATQKLNANVANHLVEEKFKDKSPFSPDGSVNKELFGDIMHDMMAVNRGIEVYLLGQDGQILYSVVLDHSDESSIPRRIDLEPIRKFIASQGKEYILGQDPRDAGQEKIFSAQSFQVEGRSGYIYIILAGQRFEEVTENLFASYFLRLGIGASIATIFFAAIIGFASIWYITKNLREIIDTVREFRDGDHNARIKEPERKDLSVLAVTFNKMADTIVKNIKELQSVESLRRELIANVSHDLRTPLALLQGYIETLQMKKSELSPDESDRYLSIIQKSSEKLSKLVDQLFEYSKLEARQIEPHKEPFSISELAHDMFEKYQQMAKKRQINLSLKIPEKIPLVYADISLVERVIQNLIDNALKFTPEGGTVSIEISSDDKKIAVGIKDTGRGIPKEELSEIFDRHKQSSTRASGDDHGAGLGLAIVSKILEIHNSTIEVMSKPNFGTTFRFELPMV